VTVRLFGLRHGTPRYTACLLAFLMMILCPVVTFSVIDIESKVPAQAMTSPPAGPVERPDKSPLPALAGHRAESIPLPAPAVTAALPTSQGRVTWQEKVDAVSIDVLPWALCVWIAGVLLLSARLLLGYVGVWRWRHDLKPLPDDVSSCVSRLASQLGLTGFDRVFISPHAAGVVAVGCLRPMVLIPASLVTRMPVDMLQAVIAHELAHIRRFDLWINLAQRCLETLLFFHPAVCGYLITCAQNGNIAATNWPWRSPVNASPMPRRWKRPVVPGSRCKRPWLWAWAATREASSIVCVTYWGSHRHLHALASGSPV
jgi:hypothetical protein